ncbi:shikimate 5-dehydrogenase i alpha [hydrocarbon metagenome]|uniref:shikimate dehydrogenase (NADP(+)) n=1 Tax=hydrocarbon metagenome TaxID=938273 RepID=A0A0W8E8W3_9ZZZZ
MDINCHTRLLAIIGNPLGHSLSPFMYNRLFDKRKLNCIYMPFEIQAVDLEKGLKSLQTLNFAGFNVTIPFKQMVIPFLDELSEEAQACQAVNLVKNEGGVLKGYNTDGQGFVRGLIQAGIFPRGRTVFIGAGGAARSIAYEMARAGMLRVDFLDIDYLQAETMAEFISSQTGIPASAAVMNQAAFDRLAPDTDILINCSPVGMSPGVDASPLASLEQIKKDAVICDIIYNPRQTKLLKMAESHNLKTINGLPMFINQALLTLEILLDESFAAAELEEAVAPHVKQ